MGRRWGCAMLVSALGCGAMGACSSFGSDPATSGTEDAAVEAGDGSASSSDGGWTPCKDRPQDPAHFCEDFDQPGTVDYGWTTDLSANGSFGETDAALSAPRALLTRVMPGPSPQKAELHVDRGPAVDLSTKNKITVAFSVRVAKPPFPSDASNNGFVQFVVLAFDDPSCVTSGTSKQRQMEIQFDPSGDCYLNAKGLRDLCQDGGDYLSTKMPLRLPDFVSDTDYRRVTIEVARTACNGQGNASLKVAIDGARDIPCISLGAGDPFGHAAKLLLTLGIYGYVSSGSFAETEIAFDNVTVDLE